MVGSIVDYDDLDYMGIDNNGAEVSFSQESELCSLGLKADFLGSLQFGVSRVLPLLCRSYQFASDSHRWLNRTPCKTCWPMWETR